MISNYKNAVIVTPKENANPVIQLVSNVEWQDTKNFNDSGKAVSVRPETSVFIYGRVAPTITVGDYIYKGSTYTDISSLTGKALRAKLDEKGALYIESFIDNTLSGIPHIELGCV